MARVQVALLRGINVGPSKRVAMADLRALMEGLGFGSVKTLLNSGNVVFSGPRPSPDQTAFRIEKALEAKLGVAARVVVISAEELAEVVSAKPLVKIADNSSRLLVGILADPADKQKLSDIAGQDWGKERIALGGAPRAVYMWMPRGVIESKLNQAVGRALGDAVTTRNWATMLKLQEMTESV